MEIVYETKLTFSSTSVGNFDASYLWRYVLQMQTYYFERVMEKPRWNLTRSIVSVVTLMANY